jgi:hypothetical protein
MPVNAEDPDDSIGSLLDRQYQCTYDYCNATTALYNALQQQGGTSSSLVGTTANLGQRATAARHNNNNNNIVAVRNATDKYMDALDRLQACMKDMEIIVAEISNDNSWMDNRSSSCHRPAQLAHTMKWSVALTEHCARSQRIVRTIATQCCGAAFHANGIPLCPSSSSSLSATTTSDHHSVHNQLKLVALATLRASIQSVQDAL